MMLHRAGNLFLANCSDVPIIHSHLLFATTFFVAVWSTPSTLYSLNCFFFFFQTVDKTQVGTLPLAAFLSSLVFIRELYFSSVPVTVNMDITLEMRSKPCETNRNYFSQPLSSRRREPPDLGSLSSYQIKWLIHSSQVVKLINTKQFAVSLISRDISFVHVLTYVVFLKHSSENHRSLAAAVLKEGHFLTGHHVSSSTSTHRKDQT